MPRATRRHASAAGLLEVAEEVQVRGGAARRHRRVPGRTPAGDDGHDSADEALVTAAVTEEPRRRTFLRARPRTVGQPVLADAEPWVDAEVRADPARRDLGQPDPAGRP